LNHDYEKCKLELLSFHAELPDTGGICVRIRAKKEPEFSFKQVRLKLVGEVLWKILSHVIGASVIATFRLAVHPISLVPDFLQIEDFPKGKDVVETRMLFGGSGKYRVRKESLMKKFEAIVQQGDPDFSLEFEYGERRLTWRGHGMLFQLDTKISAIIHSCQTGNSVSPTRIVNNLIEHKTVENLRETMLSKREMQQSMRRIVRVFPTLDPEIFLDQKESNSPTTSSSNPSTEEDNSTQKNKSRKRLTISMKAQNSNIQLVRDKEDEQIPKEKYDQYLMSQLLKELSDNQLDIKGKGSTTRQEKPLSNRGSICEIQEAESHPFEDELEELNMLEARELKKLKELERRRLEEEEKKKIEDEEKKRIEDEEKKRIEEEQKEEKLKKEQVQRIIEIERMEMERLQKESKERGEKEAIEEAEREMKLKKKEEKREQEKKLKEEKRLSKNGER